MKINFDNRIVVIVGPTSSGKTTLATNIQKNSSLPSIVISHDEVLKMIPKTQSQENINNQFRLLLFQFIVQALESENQLIILDTINISRKSLSSFLGVIKEFTGYQGIFTLLKMDLDLALHIEYTRRRMLQDSSYNINEMFCQKGIYESSEGSLNSPFPNTEEYIIKNPEDLDFHFNVIPAMQPTRRK